MMVFGACLSPLLPLSLRGTSPPALRSGALKNVQSQDAVSWRHVR
jgi:hypothetical protein